MSVGKCCFKPHTCVRNCVEAETYRRALDSFFGTVVVSDGVSTQSAACGSGGAPAYSDTKPEYYHAGPDDLIAFALKHDLGAIEFTIMRYVMRWKQKQPLLSLQKAREYLDRLIAAEEERLARESVSMASRGDTGG